jgi:hypothetical protein
MTAPYRVSNCDFEQVKRYDALVATVGFESRATHIAQVLADRAGQVWAFDYQQNHVHSYNANRHFFQDAIIEEPESAYRKSLMLLVEQLRGNLPIDSQGQARVPRIAVDISCMDRDRLARTVLALTQDQTEVLQVDFLYSFGIFDENLVGSEGTVLVNRPVEGLEGWPTDPDAGLVCLLGLGFESRLALAAVETLEPSRIIVLVPRGEDPRYDAVVDKRNHGLLVDETLAGRHDYDVQDLLQTVLDLDASVTTLTRRGRVVIVPLGPKTLVLAATLVAIAHPTNVTVWRLSADDGRTPEDRVASGSIAGLTLDVRPRFRFS